MIRFATDTLPRQLGKHQTAKIRNAPDVGPALHRSPSPASATLPQCDKMGYLGSFLYSNVTIYKTPIRATSKAFRPLPCSKYPIPAFSRNVIFALIRHPAVI